MAFHVNDVTHLQSHHNRYHQKIVLGSAKALPDYVTPEKKKAPKIRGLA
jgi:hypothetical protein